MEANAHETIQRDEHCRCGQTLGAVYAESLHGGRLHVSRSTHCVACGSQTESDFHRLPEDVRDLVLKRDGTYAVVIDANDRVRALVALRELLGISLEEARSAQLERLAQGTRTEMVWLSEQLARPGIPVRCVGPLGE